LLVEACCFEEALGDTEELALPIKMTYKRDTKRFAV
jgi:hypothetical protein